MRGSSFGQWLRRHEVATWAGVIVGLGGILASPVFGWGTPVGIALVVIGGALVGILVTAYLLTPPRFSVICLSCVLDYTMNGPRGANTTRTQTMQLKANTDLPSFVYALKKKAATAVGEETIKYRILRNGDGGWVKLKKDNILRGSSTDDSVTWTIQTPTPIKRGDVFEIVDELQVANAFPKDDEQIGKNLLFPTKLLRFSLKFCGCQIEGCLGTRFELRMIDGEPLEVKAEDGNHLVSWELADCRPGHTYRISWSWVS